MTPQVRPMSRKTLATRHIDARIIVLRDQKVMLSPDLAQLYQVKPKALIQAVKRNITRFPADFMFQLTWDEVALLRSRSVTLNERSGVASRSRPVTLKRGQNVKYAPYAFTEQGVAMLSSGPSRSTSRSCGPSCASGPWSAPWPNCAGSSMRSSAGTTFSSRMSSTRSGRSWRRRRKGPGAGSASGRCETRTEHERHAPGPNAHDASVARSRPSRRMGGGGISPPV